MKLILVVGLCSLIPLVTPLAVQEPDVQQEFNSLDQAEELGTIIEDDDRVQTNFIKILSALLIRREKAPPPEVKKAVRTMMREILNGRIEKDGYKSYLLTSMLRVIDSKPDVQMLSMLDIVESQSPKESHLAAAARILNDWLKSADGKKFLEEISLFVRSLFQRTIEKVKKPAASAGLPASGDRQRVPKPSLLPGDISGINGIDNLNRAQLSRSRLPTDFQTRRKRYSKKENVKGWSGEDDFENNRIEISTDERRRPGRPDSPPRGPDHGHGNGRPPNRYPEDNHHGYPDQRPGHPRPPNGYPDDSHRPGGGRPPGRPGYPDGGRPPHGRPGHPGGSGPEHGRPGHPRPPHGHPGDHEREPPHHHHPPGRPGSPSHHPGQDKICIERIPQRKFRTISTSDHN